ncbi:hypothetical protein GF339_03495 [candidate division KSB3 bacterium]|uniref:Uncharacterized protein n=1 Tax=candidate division KSB3 bacterium TaxID=2044937 RepID=A0A9D5Q4W6_9BACT|nr:hypothetical protein [candidate division KSB3 bacterium]MBD3323622.1 hypothetical protein [candidate division KSB3 bacterium]
MTWLPHISGNADQPGGDIAPFFPATHRDRECIGKILAMAPDWVIIETPDGQRLKWISQDLFRLGEMLM